LYRERTQPETTAFANRSRQIESSRSRRASELLRAYVDRATRHARCKSDRAFETQPITKETTMSKKLKLSHETIRVLTAETVAGVVGGQASGSSGSIGCYFRPVPDEQRRLEDLAKRGE
jgi:hypothetical protein